MTEKSSFFNSVNGDRKYQASDFAEFFNSLVTNGIFPNPSTNLQVLANDNMTVTVKTGPAWINGYHYLNDSDLILPIEVADGVLSRIDRIVIKLDTVARNITAVVKKGTFASSPVAPALQRDADAYELGIADIYVGKGVTSISQANITDLRMNTTYCGWVNSLIQVDTTAIFDQYLDWYNTKTSQYESDMASLETTYQNDIDAMEAQFQTDFTTWFEAIQGQLSGDVAANLANQITILEGAGWTNETIKGNANAIVNLAGSGRTTETVKGNADAIAAHKADYANPHQVTADQAGAIAKSLLTAAGDIIYASAAQTPARLAKGTAGQVLKMNSGAIAPEWGNSSDWELIGTLSPSAWEALFSNIPTDYKQLRLYGVMGSSNNATYTTNTVTITFNDDDTVSPGDVYLTCKGTTLVAAANLPSSTTGLYAPYTTDTNKFEFILDIDNTYTQLGYPATFTLLIRGYNGSSWFAGIPLFGHYKLNEAITRLRLYGNVGTLVGTTLKLYGKR